MKDFKKIAAKIQAEVGDKAYVKAMQAGIQVKPGTGNFKLNFYYGKKELKYVKTDTNTVARFAAGQEGSIIINLVAIATVKQELAKELKAANVIELNDKGTQACIDHISRKIETFKRVFQADKGEVSHQTLTMMQTIKDELYQYL